MAHWLAVDRCFEHYADALEYAEERITAIEGRPVYTVEIEAAVVVCPRDHGRPKTPRRRPVELGEVLTGRPGAEGR